MLFKNNQNAENKTASNKIIEPKIVISAEITLKLKDIKSMYKFSGRFCNYMKSIFKSAMTRKTIPI